MTHEMNKHDAVCLIQAAVHLLKAATAPSDGPTSWIDTRDRFFELSEEFIANKPRTIDNVTKEILQLQAERDRMINTERAEKIAAMRSVVPDVVFHELVIYTTLVDQLPFRLTSNQYETVLDIRRNEDGVIEFQVTEHGKCGSEWIEQGLLSYSLDMEDCE